MINLRYPGVRPFETNERHLFFGRARDIADLYDLVLLENLLVLFGKSGYGKSSLLKAGIIPLFTEFAADSKGQYQPLEVRFGSYLAGKSLPPLQAALNTLEKEAPLNKEADFLGAFFPEKKSLWLQCKHRQQADAGRFLMVFDQFEEFFTYPVSQQEAFATSLAEALYETTPQNIRNTVTGKLTFEQRRFLAKPFELKVIFSIRADRLSLLDSMKLKLPAILHKRYELKALDEKQARSAIVRPALLPAEDGDFSTPSFTFTDGALNDIVAKLADEKSGRIEAFQLQVVCQNLEKQVKNGVISDRDGDDQPDIYPDDLPNFDTVFEDYYKDKLSELNEAEKYAARVVIEDGLLYVNEATGEARRLSKDPGELVQIYGNQGVDHNLLQKLETTYLLRREANNIGTFNYEISHDTLIAPITRSREARRREEERNKAAKRTRRAIFTAVGAILLMFGAVVLAVWAIGERDKAREALRKLTIEQAARDLLEFKTKKQDATNFVSVKYFDLADSTLVEMDSIAVRQIELRAVLDSFKIEIQKERK